MYRMSFTQRYTRPADWAIIQDVARAHPDLPIIGNGDIFTWYEAEDRLNIGYPLSATAAALSAKQGTEEGSGEARDRDSLPNDYVDGRDGVGGESKVDAASMTDNNSEGTQAQLCASSNVDSAVSESESESSSKAWLQGKHFHCVCQLICNS